MGGAVDAERQAADYDDALCSEPLRKRMGDLQADPGRSTGPHNRNCRRCQACKASPEEKHMRRIRNAPQQRGKFSIRVAQHADSHLRQAHDLLSRTLEQAAATPLTQQPEQHVLRAFAALQRLCELVA